jgi:sulfide:quinone oxidoreductase
MAGHTVLVAGGGIGGVVAARRLRKHLSSDDRVILVERDPLLRFAPSFPWVMSGERRADAITRDVRKLRRRGIEVVEAEVTGIDAAARSVTTTEGMLSGDRLVVALGSSLVPGALDGFTDAALNFYDVDGAAACGRAVQGIESGRVVVLVSSMPYKCPAAPYESALLADTILRRRGVRDRVSVEIHTPEPIPMPTGGPILGEALVALLAQRGIGFHPQRTATAIEPGAREVRFAEGDPAGFDVLIGIPTHRPPAVIADSRLLDGKPGYVPVDARTLATCAEGVYAIGDVTALPIPGGKFLPKAGVFAEREAEIVAHRIADELGGKSPSSVFDGKGACFLEIGGGRAAFASGDFFSDGPPVEKLRGPNRRWHLGKVAFEKMWLNRWVR